METKTSLRRKKDKELYMYEQERRKRMELEMELTFEDSTIVFDSNSSTEAFKETLSTEHQMIEISPDIIYERLLSAQQVSLEREVQEVRRIFSLISTLGLTPNQEQHLFSLFTTEQLKRLIDIYEGSFTNPNNNNYKKSTPKDVSRILDKPIDEPVMVKYPLVKAKFNFKAQQERDLEFKKGDIIEVLSERPNGWWEGRIEHRAGLFPSNYTEPYEDLSPSNQNESVDSQNKSSKSNNSSNDSTNSPRKKPHLKKITTSNEGKVNKSVSTKSPFPTINENFNLESTSSMESTEKHTFDKKSPPEKVKKPVNHHSTYTTKPKPKKFRKTKKNGTLKPAKTTSSSLNKETSSETRSSYRNREETTNDSSEAQVTNSSVLESKDPNKLKTESSDEPLPSIPKRSDSQKIDVSSIPDMNTLEVGNFLESIGLGKYRETFIMNDITGKVLLSLSNRELQEELGIKKFGHRKILLLKINEHSLKSKKQETDQRREQEKRLFNISRLEKLKSFGSKKGSMEMIRKQKNIEISKKNLQTSTNNLLGKFDEIHFFESEEGGATNNRSSNKVFIGDESNSPSNKGKNGSTNNERKSDNEIKREGNDDVEEDCLLESSLSLYSDLYSKHNLSCDEKMLQRENEIATRHFFSNIHWLRAFSHKFSSRLEGNGDVETESDTDDVYNLSNSTVKNRLSIMVNPKDDKVIKESLYRIILKGTKKILKEGKIESMESTYSFTKHHLKNNLAKTKIYDSQSEFTHTNIKNEKVSVKMRTQVHFMDQDFIDVAVWLQKSKNVNPLVVVPSSFSYDAVTQGNESSLEKNMWCRTTVPLIFNKKNPVLKFPLENKQSVIYTPDLLVFRENESSGFSHSVPPEKVSFLHISPLQNPKLIKNNTNNNTNNNTTNNNTSSSSSLSFSQKDKAALTERISLAIQVGLENGHDAIIFSAVGCGKSSNSSSLLVAKLIKQVLGQYKQRYSHIVFAIQDQENTKNLKTFQKVFQTPATTKKKKRRN